MNGTHKWMALIGGTGIDWVALINVALMRCTNKLPPCTDIAPPPPKKKVNHFRFVAASTVPTLLLHN